MRRNRNDQRNSELEQLDDPRKTRRSALQTDRVVVITGAAGGIGSVLVDRFLDNGDTVLATDVDEDTLGVWRDNRIDDETDSQLITAAADISTEDDCAALADVARDRVGRVDVLVNCAGYFPITPFEELSLEEWRQVIDINLTGTFLMTRAFLPLLKESDAGRIINFGSGSIFDGTPGQSHYVGAKAGVVGFSRSLAREVGDYGITVNIVTPGLTVTETVRENFSEEILKAQRDGRAIQRDEKPEDLVGTVFFLASSDAEFITGQIINVDGGAFMY